MICKTARVNQRKKCLEIETEKGVFGLPFSKLSLVPTLKNPIDKIIVDQEFGNEAVTYTLLSGDEETVHVDAFLDYNCEPDFMKELTLYNLSLRALDLLRKSKLSKREIARKLRTSPAQLYRLLNTANYKKSTDEMFRLIACLGGEVDIVVHSPIPKAVVEPQNKFKYLTPEELNEIRSKTVFRPMLRLSFKKAA